MTKQTQKLVLMLVIGILIGTTAVMGWNARNTGNDEIAPNTTPTGATTSDMVYTSASTTIARTPNLPSAPMIPANTRIGLTVSDQSAGNTVMVSGLSVTEKWWVAVYNDKLGSPAWILGAARVHPGDTSAVVELISPNKPGNTYYVALLHDDGDDSFNRLSDLPPFAPEKVVIVSFMAL